MYTETVELIVSEPDIRESIAEIRANVRHLASTMGEVKNEVKAGYVRLESFQSVVRRVDTMVSKDEFAAVKEDLAFLKKVLWGVASALAAAVFIAVARGATL